MSQASIEPVVDRPASLIDLLDGSFAVLRQRSRVIITIVAGFVVPVAVLQGWVARDDLGGASFQDLINDPTLAQEVSDPAGTYDAGYFASQGLGLLVVAICGVAVGRVVTGWFEGDDVGAGEALRFTARRSGAILGAFVLNHLVQLVGFILLVVPGIAAVVAFSLTSPVLAAEPQLGPVAAMRRSAQLVKRRAPTTVGAIILLAVVLYGVSSALSAAPSVVAIFIGVHRAWPIVSAANVATLLVSIPVTVATMNLVYYDIRFRTEGLDLHRRLAARNDPAATQGP